jgi:hypothetical protein
MRRRTFLAGFAVPVLSRAAARPIAIAPGGALLLDGRPQFVLGLYQLPKVENPWREAREAGFNLVHVSPSSEEFAQCRQNGLRCWITLGSISPEKAAADQERIGRLVAKFQKDPALLFWETEDEPAFVWKKKGPRIPPAQIVSTYRFVKSLDPIHPLYLNHAPVNLESTLREYNAGADILATDIYPVIPRGVRESYALWPDGQQGDLLNETISQVGQYADRMRRVAGRSRSVWMVLQAFAWENLREKNRNPKMVLYPNREQLRFMAYQSLIHGANGLLFWGLSSTPTNAPLWPDLKAVARDLARLGPVLAADPIQTPLHVVYRENGHSVDRGIEWTAREDGGHILLICANADRNPLDVSFQGLHDYSRVERVGEPGSAPIQDGAFDEAFAPFGVTVYRVRR